MFIGGVLCSANQCITQWIALNGLLVGTSPAKVLDDDELINSPTDNRQSPHSPLVALFTVHVNAAAPWRSAHLLYEPTEAPEQRAR